MKLVTLSAFLLVSFGSFASQVPCSGRLEADRSFDLPSNFLSPVDTLQAITAGREYRAFDMTRIATGRPERAEYELATDGAGNFLGVSMALEGHNEQKLLRYSAAPPRQDSLGKFTFSISQTDNGLILNLKNSQTKKNLNVEGIRTIGKIRLLADGSLGVLIDGSLARFNKRLEPIKSAISGPSTFTAIRELSRSNQNAPIVDFVSFQHNNQLFLATVSASGRGRGFVSVFNLTESKLQTIINSSAGYGDLSGLAVVKGKALLFFRSGMGEALLFSWAFP